MGFDAKETAMSLACFQEEDILKAAAAIESTILIQAFLTSFYLT